MRTTDQTSGNLPVVIDDSDDGNKLTKDQKIRLMYERFIHDNRSYLEQWVNARGINYDRKTDELTEDIVLQHLQGSKTVSVFPIAEDDTVKWLCFDVDISPQTKRAIKQGEMTHEDAIRKAQQTVRTLVRFLYRVGIPFRVEFSGNKGYHVWIFFDSPVPTHKAYDLGQSVLVRVEVDPALAVEVFPKHRSINDAAVGNALKMPLGLHQKTQVRCFFVKNTFEPYKDQWKILTDVKFLTEPAIDAILEEYQVKDVVQSAPTETKFLPNFVCLTEIMEQGAHDGVRDEGIFQVACYLRSRNIPEDLAEGLLAAVNEKSPDPLPEAIVEIKLKSAYSKGYFPNPCRNPMFDSICSSQCSRFARKVEQRWTRFGKDAQGAVGVISKE